MKRNKSMAVENDLCIGLNSHVGILFLLLHLAVGWISEDVENEMVLSNM